MLVFSCLRRLWLYCKAMDLEKIYSLESPLEPVFEQIQDLKLYGAVHPLIKSVEFIETNNLGNAYQILEQPYRWLPFRIRYKAIVWLNNKEIKYTVSGIPWTEVEINYSFETNEANNRTKVKFQLQIKGKLPRFVQKILQWKMAKAQDQLMGAIVKESATGS